MQQLQQQVFDVFADVSCLGQCRCIADGKWHVQYPRERPGQQRLARTRRADQQNVRLLDLNVRPFEPQRQPLVVVVNGNGEDPLAVLLADDVLIELRDDLFRRRDAGEERLRRSATALLLLQNRLAQVDTLAADVNVAWPLDERTYVAVALAAKRTEGVFLRGARPTTPSGQVLTCGHGHSLILQ